VKFCVRNYARRAWFESSRKCMQEEVVSRQLYERCSKEVRIPIQSHRPRKEKNSSLFLSKERGRRLVECKLFPLSFNSGFEKSTVYVVQEQFACKEASICAKILPC